MSGRSENCGLLPALRLSLHRRFSFASLFLAAAALITVIAGRGIDGEPLTEAAGERYFWCSTSAGFRPAAAGSGRAPLCGVIAGKPEDEIPGLTPRTWAMA